MLVIGLTGGIASGKSTVARSLKNLGAEIIDADEVSHELAKPNAPLWEKYVARYGEQALLADGNLDRAAIGKIVFSDANERKWMNEISHPMIHREMLARLEKCRESGAVAAVLDVPLLYEVGWDKSVDEVWVVYVDEATQLKRLMARDGLSEKLAKERIAAQMPLAKKKERADLVIDSGQTIEKTLAQVKKAWGERIRAIRRG